MKTLENHKQFKSKRGKKNTCGRSESEPKNAVLTKFKKGNQNLGMIPIPFPFPSIQVYKGSFFLNLFIYVKFLQIPFFNSFS